MQIFWKNKRIKEICESKDKMKKAKLDKKEQKNLVKAILSLKNVKSIDQMPKNFHCHPIKKGKKFLSFAIDLPSVGGGRGKNRLLVKPPDGLEYDLAKLQTITSIEILEIKNYHK